MIKAEFLGNKKIDIKIDGFNIKTDIPVNHGGEGSAPSPFDYLHAALLSCVSNYIVIFLERNKYDISKVFLTLECDYDAEGNIAKATAIIHTPADFPVRYDAPMAAMAMKCKIAAHMKFPHNVVVMRDA